jgi:hypothetical protein
MAGSQTSLDKKVSDHVEEASQANVSLQRYPLLRDLSEDELVALDKAVLRKLDWKFLPTITMMLLMK